MADSLAGLADVKTWLSVTTNADDTLLTGLIAAGSAMILQYLNRPSILSRSISEKYSGVGGTRMVLRSWPVTAIASLSIDGVAVSAAASPTANGYLASDLYDGVGPGAICEIALNSAAFTRGRFNVAVTYTAGYAAVPSDVKQACVELCGEVYKYRPRIGEISRALPGGGGTATFSIVDLSPRVKMMLSSYRAVVPV